MANDNDKDKIGGINKLKQSDAVEKARAVSDVEAVQKTESVGKVKQTKAVRAMQNTRVLTSAERDQLRMMISEEADKMFESGVLPKEQKEVVENAVKQVIDAAIIDED